MVKLCMYSFILISLPPYYRKCGTEDLIMYAYCIVFPSIFKKGGSRNKGAVQECTSLSPLPLCIVMFNLGVVCRVLLCNRIVGSLGWGAGCMLQSVLRWGFGVLSSFSDSLIFSIGRCRNNVSPQ